MKTTIRNSIGGLAFLSALILLLQPATVCAQGTAFTYQGRLEAGGTAYTGLAEMQFSLWDAASGGSQLGSTLTIAPVGVSNGLFTVSLDFGAGVFTGPARWLDIAVRTNLLGFTTLSPRQPLTAAPYAITAGNLTGTLPASQLSGLLPGPSLGGTYSGAVTFNNAANSFTGSGAGLTGLNASQLSSGTVPDARLAANVARTNQVWLLGGNAGTTPGTHFLGTTDNQPLEVRVNNRRALRLEPNTNNAPNVIGGYAGNYVSNTVIGATIGGGGAGDWFGNAYTNRVLRNFGTVGGGWGNIASGETATVGGGGGNTASGSRATVGGGSGNTTGGDGATVGGGDNNTASAPDATVGGGWNNTASGWYATVDGGVQNTANGGGATVGGGTSNTASGTGAVVPGGRENVSAGSYSFAAGFNARANHDGSFVWSSRDKPAPSFAADRFHVHAAEGLSVDYAAQRPDGGGTKWVLIGGSLLPNTTISTWTGAKLTDGGV
ncbi:MAG TPA: hypothetical protein VNO52_14410, partial [Methylomirabilota bacterium]|nr:hypothetical protein [Methylomirabilota bacterium]